VFSLDEMVEAFEISRVNPNPARFDIKKCEAINGTHMRMLDPDDAASRLVPYLQTEGLVATPPTETELQLVAAGMPLVQERISTFVEGAVMLRFLFVDEAMFSIDEADGEAESHSAGVDVVRAAADALEGVSLGHGARSRGLAGAVVDEWGLKRATRSGRTRAVTVRSGRRAVRVDGAPGREPVRSTAGCGRSPSRFGPPEALG
jgi:glutamyl-tRNA synthetase